MKIYISVADCSQNFKFENNGRTKADTMVRSSKSKFFFFCVALAYTRRQIETKASAVVETDTPIITTPRELNN